MNRQTDLERNDEEQPDKNSMQTVKLWFNGACPGNGIEDDRAGYGLVFGSKSDEQYQYQHESGRIDHGPEVTAPVAQYIALINGLQTVYKEYEGQQPVHIDVYGNAKTIIEQITGESDTNKAHLIKYRKEACAQLDQFEEWSIGHVGKSDSDELSDARTNARGAIPDDQQEGEQNG